MSHVEWPGAAFSASHVLCCDLGNPGWPRKGCAVHSSGQSLGSSVCTTACLDRRRMLNGGSGRSRASTCLFLFAGAGGMASTGKRPPKSGRFRPRFFGCSERGHAVCPHSLRPEKRGQKRPLFWEPTQTAVSAMEAPWATGHDQVHSGFAARRQRTSAICAGRRFDAVIVFALADGRLGAAWPTHWHPFLTCPVSV